MFEVMSRAFPANSSVVAEVHPSPNYDERPGARKPDMIILHYTGMQDGQSALDRLCDPQSRVSSHYLVFEDGRVVQMVEENRRAWHAGKSFWAGETDLNGCSIGIEIVNPGHEFGYPPFPKRQIAAVITLCRGIGTRNTIPRTRVLAHSDVAPSRKQDPGEKFPWRTLYDSGIGLWVEPAPMVEGERMLALGDRGDAVFELQEALAEYGYGIAANSNFDSTTHDVVAAFQRHFRPERVDGVADRSTRMTLQDLLTKRR